MIINMLTWCCFRDILIGKYFPIARKFRPIPILNLHTLIYNFFRDFFPDVLLRVSGYISRFGSLRFFSEKFFSLGKIFLMGCVCCAQKKSV